MTKCTDFISSCTYSNVPNIYNRYVDEFVSIFYRLAVYTFNVNTKDTANLYVSFYIQEIALQIVIVVNKLYDETLTKKLNCFMCEIINTFYLNEKVVKILDFCTNYNMIV